MPTAHGNGTPTAENPTNEMPPTASDGTPASTAQHSPSPIQGSYGPAMLSEKPVQKFMNINPFSSKSSSERPSGIIEKSNPGDLAKEIRKLISRKDQYNEKIASGNHTELVKEANNLIDQGERCKAYVEEKMNENEIKKLSSSYKKGVMAAYEGAATGFAKAKSLFTRPLSTIAKMITYPIWSGILAYYPVSGSAASAVWMHFKGECNKIERADLLREACKDMARRNFLTSTLMLWGLSLTRSLLKGNRVQGIYKTPTFIEKSLSV